VRIEVSDDGVGGANPRAGSGLLNLVDRIQALGGTLDVASPPSVGTRVIVVLPLGSQSGEVSRPFPMVR
jgi:signal transduction histidine kinase